MMDKYIICHNCLKPVALVSEIFKIISAITCGKIYEEIAYTCSFCNAMFNGSRKKYNKLYKISIKDRETEV